jgi:hypothetical protein
MKLKNRFLLGSMTAVATVVVFISACNKKFDEPAAFVAPNITANATIKGIKSLHSTGGFERIVGDSIISGVVIADDKSGNLYKQIFIQDATGAIIVELDRTNLYGDYPVGRTVYIKAKDLYLSDYGGMISIGAIDRSAGSPSLSGIPATLIENYVVKGAMGASPAPKVVSSLASLGTGMQDPSLGTLIQLNGYEFSKSDTGKPFSDTSALKKSVNYTIKDCGGTNSIIVRTSAFANFAGTKVPGGNGTIIGVYTVFGSTKQLIIREITDVQFTGARCFLYEENFDSYAVTGTAPLVIPGWKNIMETGDVPYTLAAFSGSVFPKVSAFTSTVLATTNISTWLISPDITLPSGGAPMYSFTCSRRYPVGTFKAYVSTNYNGTNLATATWTLLTTVPNGSAAAFTPFDAFGPFNFSAYAGQKINLAFRYEAPLGTAAANVATFEVDDLKITK